jgi:valyl-tRNA synthetase
MDKAYDHNSTEDGIYQSWEDSGNMRADNTSDKEPFTIVLPPPNVTGQLHLGHAAMLAIEDIMIRYQKMTGKEVLWLPGTDHAAIATENVVLKHLGIQSREEMGREEFLGECRKFAQEKHDRIVHQIKKMGAWLDWSREAYTFDDERNHSVNTIFKKLYDDGLIVRGHRMINWSVGAQSVIADDEVEWEDNEGEFYDIQCGPFIIGTSRPETKCADSPVVINPAANYVKAEKETDKSPLIISKHKWDDGVHFQNEYDLKEVIKGKKLEGMEFEFETYAGVRKFYVLVDECVDPKFGTGAMTISTSHSLEDYELAQRHDLPMLQKIDFEGKMTAVAGPCEGMTVAEARKESVKHMEEKGLLIKRIPYSNRVPKCYRSGCVIEPMISPQWFVSVEKEFTDKFTGKKTTLKKLTQEAVRGGDVKIIPKQFEKTYFQWIDNLRDWCISRQIWWGHQIPVWYDEKGMIAEVGKRKSVYFIRHGESEGNAQGFIQGQQEGNPLTEKGRDQVKKSAQSLVGKTFKKIISSDLKRAKESAEILKEELGIDAEIEIWPELREWNTGTATMKSIKEVFGTDKFPYDKMAEKFEAGEFGPEAETLEKLLKRGKTVLKKLEKEHDVLVIAHGGLLGTMKKFTQDGHLEGLSTFFKQQWDPKNSAVIELPTSYLKQDKDTLDTWFSSALWPLSTLGWPNEEDADFKKFHTTDVLETGHDILFFWVARMIMFGRYATGKYPFETVYLHGMVTDEHGKKMSKSKNNGIDPLEMIDEFGADAVRLSLVIGTSPGNPIPIGKAKIGGYRNFVNKLWNAGRFVQMQLEDGESGNAEPKSLADKWIASRFSTVSKEIATHLQKHEISIAGDKIYHFVWDEFCDWYIEASKVEKNPAFLKHIFLEILKLTHPLCPFITEKLWGELADDGFLVDQEFPISDFADNGAEKSFSLIQEVVTEIRRVRADNQLNPKEKLSFSTEYSLNEPLIETLANVKSRFLDVKMTTKIVVGGHEIFIQIPVDEKRIAREKTALEGQIKSLEVRLGNKGYVDKAPAHLIEQTNKELEEAKEKLKKLS